MVYNITYKETQPVCYSHNNGTNEELLSRFAISELCKGWPVYRDASEWKNYRSIFAKKGAKVWTTWSGGKSIEDFIDVSQKGRADGDFIMHRENGTLVDLNLREGRAIGKMKATITQRFQLDGILFDVDCDCRFIFFVRLEDDGWKIQYVRNFYEKDRVSPVNGKDVPEFRKEDLEKYPEGYQYLGASQEKLGHPILCALPNMNNDAFYKLYDAMAKWLAGEEVDLNWD